MNALAADLGIALPRTPDLAAAGAAAALILVAAAAAWFAGRRLGPRLAGFWERKAGARTEGLGPRMCALARWLVLWAALTVALAVGPWPPLASALLGLVCGAAAALLVVQVGRGLHLPRWAALLLALFAFVAILSGAVGGLAPLSDALEAFGFTLAGRRFTLLGLIQIVVALLALYAVARVVIRVAGHSIRGAGGLDPTQQLLAQKLAAIVIVVIAFFVGIDLIGIDLTALAVFSGALGLAVGFGLQKTVGNLFAGIILLMDRSIKPGDVISVGETFGSVSKIGVRAVSIVTREGKEYLIPNEILMTETARTPIFVT